MMTSFKARVRNGRLVLDEPTDLPEGCEVELIRADALDGDDLDDMDAEERKRLEEALERAEMDVRAGRTRPLRDVLRDVGR